MAHAKISIPGGISMEVDGTPDEVASVLEKLRSEQVEASRGRTGAHDLRKSKGVLGGLIDQIKSEEFFKTPRGLSDVQKKLAELGHTYPVTTLSGAMQTQTRNRRLRRFKQHGKYVYVQ